MADGADPAGTLMVIFSLGGLRMSTHVRPRAVRCQTGFVAVEGEPRVVLDPFPAKGTRGVLEGGEARLLRGDDEIASQTLAPPGPGRWSELDLLSFTGTTLWTWIALPLLLDAPEVTVRHLGERRLEVTVPPDWPATSTRHVLELDDEGRVVRHQEAWPPSWPAARTARPERRGRLVHELSEHCEFGGVPVATRRRTRSSERVTVLWADVVAAALHPKLPTKPLN